jgi:hypothetical protein
LKRPVRCIRCNRHSDREETRRESCEHRSRECELDAGRHVCKEPWPRTRQSDHREQLEGEGLSRIHCDAAKVRKVRTAETATERSRRHGIDQAVGNHQLRDPRLAAPTSKSNSERRRVKVPSKATDRIRRIVGLEAGGCRPSVLDDRSDKPRFSSDKRDRRINRNPKVE